MEDEALRIADYLPYKISEPRLKKLIGHHFDSFVLCIKYELYSSSLIHLHLLYMIFVYLQIQRIAEFDKNAYRLSLIGFNRDEKDLLKESNYPLSFSVINEKTVFRFFRLNNIEDEFIRKISKPVNRRNNHAHASEEIECSTMEEFEFVLQDYIDNMEDIMNKNMNILIKNYEDTSVQILNDPDYEITPDDLEGTLFIPNYFSVNELKIVCKGRKDRLSKFISTSLDIKL